MKWLAVIAAVAATPAMAVDVPSGTAIELQEVLVEDMGDEVWLRFRFVAPALTREATADGTQGIGNDMEYLCREVALPYMVEYALEGQMVVVSVADRPTEFGVADRDATQIFEAYRIVDRTCIWDGF